MEGQKRHSILCPHCRKLVSIDEPTCPHCGLHNPGARWRNHFLMKGLFGEHQLIRNIISVNAAMFILSIAINPTATGFSMNPLDFLSPDNKTLLLLGATGRIPIDQFHRWWTSPVGELSSRKHSPHPLQYDCLLPDRPPYPSRIWQIQNGFHLHDQWCGRVSALLCCWHSLHFRSIRRGLRPYRSGSVLRQKPWRVLWSAGLSAGRGVGSGDLHFRFSLPGYQQLGSRRGLAMRSGDGICVGLSGTSAGKILS